ncbi:hypothetical protein AXF42_Ash005666 [Apostasia shenzhenica]|uniref:SAWADEE domain-containing protein n=1 Tax=Apostasia shenzhenica TaxID=1088818 RepID=A0A2I0BC04_9ASPA|nr:hypothetical protein AXF42_Ash005666 [Apostasia shenzhenica]
MVGVQSKPMKRLAVRFSRPEIRYMEELLQKGSDELSDPNFHQKLADEFNSAPDRFENRAIKVEQVQRWFMKRLVESKTEEVSSPCSSKEMSPAEDADQSIFATQSCSDMPKDNLDKLSEEGEMEFEAMSARDQAWYDVFTFLSHRVVSTGEVEVRVRFAGFGSEDDEWVNVRKAVRERSIPMESSECWMVKEGDVLLCFREKDETAHHFDARVLSIERKMHDIRGCRCIFFVQYDHDQIEERVQLSQLCRRPS